MWPSTDEIHHLATDVQPQLLRAVETKRIAPVGTTVTHAVDVQICTGTNVDLRERIADGRFAADLFYRLRQAEIRLPPLRERREEIPYLVRLVLTNEKLEHLHIRHEFIEACLLRAWRGNVRELLAAVREAAHRANNSGAQRLEPKHLEPGETSAPKAKPAPEKNAAIAALPKHRQASLEVFREALERSGGSVKAAAEEVGIEISTAYEWKDLLAGKPRRRR